MKAMILICQRYIIMAVVRKTSLKVGAKYRNEIIRTRHKVMQVCSR